MAPTRTMEDSDLPGAKESAPETVGEGAPQGPATDLEPGRGQVLGRYVLLERIGAGGMGVVYAAYDPELDRRIALKLLRTRADLDDDSSRARLLREAQTLAKISHPNVITVHDVGTIDDQLFIAMELVVGEDLKSWLSKPRPWSLVLEVLLQAARGLAAAHREGLVHRDFKPGNVLVGADPAGRDAAVGLVRVVDFGLARRVDQVDSPRPEADVDPLVEHLGRNAGTSSLDQKLTRTGAIAGTPAYMSPEQHIRGPVDALSDQFSFCVTAYEALYGVRPYAGKSRVDLMMQVTQEQVVPPPSSSRVPAWIGKAILQGLAADPAARHPSMEALIAALQADPRRRRRTVMLALGLGTAIGVTGFVVSRTESKPCQGAQSMLHGIWDPARADAVAQAFGATDVPYADSAIRYAHQRLDAYTRDWTAARTEACVATRIRGEQSEELMDRRISCLDRRKQELSALVELLVEADADLVEHVSDATRNLSPIAECNDTQGLLAGPDATGPEASPELETIYGLLARASALRVAGRYAEAMTVAEQALTAARRSERLWVVAEAAIELGQAQERAGKRKEAVQTLHEAARAATSAGHDVALAKAWIQLVWNLGAGEHDTQTALMFADYAEAMLERVNASDTALIELRSAQGSMHWSTGEYQKAHDLQARAVALQEQRDADDPYLADLLVQYGNTLVGLGEIESAREAFERALKLATSARGQMHPSVGVIHNALGNVAFRQGDLEAAEHHYELAFENQQAALGPEHPDIMFSLGNLGEIRRMRGEYEQALQAMTRVWTIVQATYPAVHREVGMTQHNLATIHRERGEPEIALAHYRRALEVREDVHGEHHAYVANTLTGMGQALLDLSRAAEALPHLRRAVEIRERAEPDPLREAESRFALARCLSALRREPDRASSLASTARERLAALKDPIAESERKRIEAWLEEHSNQAQ